MEDSPTRKQAAAYMDVSISKMERIIASRLISWRSSLGAWDDLGDQYQSGDVVSHNGQLWQFAFRRQNVWKPGTVDNRFWAKHKYGE